MSQVNLMRTPKSMLIRPREDFIVRCYLCKSDDKQADKRKTASGIGLSYYCCNVAVNIADRDQGGYPSAFRESDFHRNSLRRLRQLAKAKEKIFASEVTRGIECRDSDNTWGREYWPLEVTQIFLPRCYLYCNLTVC